MSRTPRICGRISLSAAVLGILFGGSACSGSPDRTAGPGEDVFTLTLVAGSFGSDTIGALLEQQPLVVRVDLGLLPARGKIVDFQSLTHGTLIAGLEPPTSLSDRQSVVTDGDGFARAFVRLGAVGIARIAVSLAGVVGADTAVYEIRPGRPFWRRLSIGDSGVYVGEALSISASVVDRVANVLPDPANVRVLSGPVSWLDPTRLRADGIGTAVVTVDGAGEVADTIRISVPPRGEVVYEAWDSYGTTTIELAQLDGSAVRSVVETLTSGGRAAMQPAWHPDRDRIVYSDGRQPVRLFIASASGSFPAFELSPDLAAGGDQLAPAVSADGSWVYFGGRDRLWRVRLDGTGAESIGQPTAGVESYPSPSPDNSRVVFHNDAGEIRIKSVLTGDVAPFAVSGYWPAWSPDGEWIAFAPSDGSPTSDHRPRLFVVRPDGTGLREVAENEPGYWGPISWSPDGAWILVGVVGGPAGQASTNSAAVSIDTGLTVVLPGTVRSSEFRAWRPL